MIHLFNKTCFLSLIFILLSQFVIGQTEIHGLVVDKETHRPLPFVNIVYSAKYNLGTTTDLDGRFKINSKVNIKELSFFYMGYNDTSISSANIKLENLTIKLQPKAYVLNDVQVYAKENPAHRIINQAIINRKINKPESLSSFKYDTYNKMFFTFDMMFYKNGDTLTSDDYHYHDTLTKIDSNILEINKFRNDQYLFLMESVSQKKYKKPGKVNEKVIASRVSGLQNPAFALLGTQLQSFTIYSDYISIMEKTYLSPLSKNSTSKYLFILQDTLINSRNDTTYTLSYRPRKNKNFEGLSGIIQINTNRFAIENFTTKPIAHETYEVVIRQKYEFVQDSAWFPTQLDADLTFKNILSLETSESNSNSEEGTPDNTYIYGKSKTYIKNINLNPNVKNREFSHIAVDYDEEANHKDSIFWSQYRVDTISQKELNTYRTIDSLGKELNFDKNLKLLSDLTQGRLSLGPISLQLDQLMSFNMAEGYRLGAGVSTNEKLTKHATLGGYFAYGFRDEEWKYGGNLKINLRDHFDSRFELKYNKDVAEVGNFNFLEANATFSPETYRDYLIQNVVYEESAQAILELRFMYYLKTRFYAKFSKVDTKNMNYEFNKNQSPIHLFEIPELGLQMRYAYHEHYIRTPMGIQALKTKFPVLFFNINKSIVFDDYQLDYTQIWAKIEKRFTIRNAGVTSVSLQAGYAWGDLPYHKLFNGRGSYYPFSVVALNSFGTMRLNEFASDRFVYLFYRHNFGQHLIKNEWMQPEFSVVHHMGWGTVNQKEQHLGLALKTMDKGYVESGIVIDNLFTYSLFKYGIGVYYRYGAYAYEDLINNFGFKLSLQLKLFDQ
jgi:hypothetical protein